MLAYLIKHSWLLITVSAIPLICDIAVGQMARITDQSYVPALPERVIMLGPSIVLGATAATVNCLLVLLLLNIFAVQRYIWLYAICWTIPFTLASVYGFLMGAGCPSPGSLITHLMYGVKGFFIAGFVAGGGGLGLAVALSIIIAAMRK
jgi:hypothetical protein